jgi:hypothetical protein
MQGKKLTGILSLASIDGAVAIAAASGLFKPGNALMLAFCFLAGPAALLAAIMLDGGVRERMIAALFAGLIATIMIVVAAGFGPELLKFVDLRMIKIIGGLAVMVIGLLVMGIKIPSMVPAVMIIGGIMLSFGVKLFQ